MPAMFIALSDGKTISDLAGCTIVSIPDGTSVDEISERAEIVYTFTGDESTNYPDAFAALRRQSAPVIPREPARDHEHCAEIGTCWQDREPCPAMPFRPELSEAERERVRGRLLVDHSESMRDHKAGEPADAIRDAISDLRAYARSIGAVIGEASYSDAIDSAASLREPGEPNDEYERGQRETLAQLFPVLEMGIGERGEEIEKDIAAMVGRSTR